MRFSGWCSLIRPGGFALLGGGALCVLLLASGCGLFGKSWQAPEGERLAQRVEAEAPERPWLVERGGRRDLWVQRPAAAFPEWAGQSLTESVAVDWEDEAPEARLEAQLAARDEALAALSAMLLDLPAPGGTQTLGQYLEGKRREAEALEELLRVSPRTEVTETRGGRGARLEARLDLMAPALLLWGTPEKIRTEATDPEAPLKDLAEVESFLDRSSAARAEAEARMALRAEIARRLPDWDRQRREALLETAQLAGRRFPEPGLCVLEMFVALPAPDGEEVK